MTKGTRLCSPRKNRNWCKRKGSFIKPQDCFFVYTNSDCFLNNLLSCMGIAFLVNGTLSNGRVWLFYFIDNAFYWKVYQTEEHMQFHEFLLVCLGILPAEQLRFFKICIICENVGVFRMTGTRPGGLPPHRHVDFLAFSAPLMDCSCRKLAHSAQTVRREQSLCSKNLRKFLQMPSTSNNK